MQVFKVDSCVCVCAACAYAFNCSMEASCMGFSIYIWFIYAWLFSPRKVLVDGKVVSKAGTPGCNKAVVEIIAEVPKYVCR